MCPNRRARSAHFVCDSRNDVGTLDYMAPEVIEHEAENGQVYDEKVDIWAIGIICYELLHGVPPFSNLNMEQTCFNIARATFQTSPQLSSECIDFINDVLKKEHQQYRLA
eukprot:9491974-Pyramimonas_sp.AAC.1